MPIAKDPPAINWVLTQNRSPGRVLVDVDAAPFGTLANPIFVNGGGGGGNASVGAIGAAAPASGTQVAGPDPIGNLTAPQVTTAAPVGAAPGMVVRIAGTPNVIAAGSGAAGAPAAGVVTVQGIAGGTVIPVTDNTTSTLNNGAETAVGAAAVQVLAANAARKSALIQNTGSANIRVGAAGVTATTGLRLVPNGVMELSPPYDPVNAIFAIREGATDSIAFALEAT